MSRVTITWKKNVKSVSDLPDNARDGDGIFVEDRHTAYVFDGKEDGWFAFGISEEENRLDKVIRMMCENE